VALDQTTEQSRGVTAMGHTNKKKLEDLLDELEKENGGNDQTPFDSTGLSDDDWGSDSSDFSGSWSVEKEWIPDLGWQPDIRLGLNESLKQYESLRDFQQDHTSYRNAEIPSSYKMGLDDICRYVPLVKETGKRVYNEIRDENPLHFGALGLKVHTSLLDTETVPWKVSKYRIRKEKEGTERDVAAAVVEFGVPCRSGSDAELLSQVIETLKATTGHQNNELNLEQAEFSHEDEDIYYFPLKARAGGVSLPGVMTYNDLIGVSSTAPVLDWEYVETLKKHEIPENRLIFSSDTFSNDFSGGEEGVASKEPAFDDF